MAYDAELAGRYHRMLPDGPGFSEKRMMGGLCFFLNGNMIGGVDRTKAGAGRFMFRVGKALADRAAALPGAEAVDLGGRRMAGFYFVDADTTPEAALADWMALALEHVRSLPPK